MCALRTARSVDPSGNVVCALRTARSERCPFGERETRSVLSDFKREDTEFV